MGFIYGERLCTVQEMDYVFCRYSWPVYRSIHRSRVGRYLTDVLVHIQSTLHWLSVDRRPILRRDLVNMSVKIMDYQPCLDRVMANYQLSVDWLSREYGPSVDWVSTECWPIYWLSIHQVSTNTSTNISVETTYSKHDPRTSGDSFCIQDNPRLCGLWSIAVYCYCNVKFVSFICSELGLNNL